MKKLLYLIVLLPIMFFYSCEEPQDVTDSLVIYAYDSFTSDWGPGPVIVSKFEEKFGVNVELVPFNDAGAVLTKAISEKDAPVADLIIGVDNNMAAKAEKAGILREYSSLLLDDIAPELKFPEKTNLVPFDYGYFSINYDSEKITNPPKSLEDLTKPEFKDSLILMDPRTSSPGLGFLLWTIAEYGEDYLDFWDRLEPSILTIADGWSSGYGLYTEGEAPMVLSYTTSPSYHVEFEETTRYRASIFDNGNYKQLEGVGLIKGSSNQINATIFVDFLLTEVSQEVLPLTNFMYPVNSKVELPESFDYAPKPDTDVQLDYNVIEENYETWIRDWSENQVK